MVADGLDFEAFGGRVEEAEAGGVDARSQGLCALPGCRRCNFYLSNGKDD